MSLYLGDLNTRARGLRTHLLSPHDLDRLARSASLFALQRDLGSSRHVPAEASATPATLEQAVRRHSASQMAVLERWCGEERHEAFSVLFEDEDRRSIQSILRGADEGAASAARLNGLIPTKSLPERALLTLAEQPTPADVVRMLILWRHPFGAPLLAAASRAHPSLFELEVELQRAFAHRASRRAQRGGSHLVDYVHQVIDVMNTWTVMLHFAERAPSIGDLVFVEGGRYLTRSVFERLMKLTTQAEVNEHLASLLHASALAPAFQGGTEDLAALEAAMLRAQIKWQSRAARVDPNGSAPLIGFALELRAEVLNLRRIIWGVTLRAPSTMIQTGMVFA